MSDPALAELLSEMKRLHRRLSVMSDENRLILGRVKRLEFLLTELLERPERKREIRDAALQLFSDQIDAPDDLRKLLPGASDGTDE